jgi:hypothetical protein
MIEPRPDPGPSASARRLLAALALTALLIGLFTAVVYRGGLAQSAASVGGLGILLAVALGVAWASQRKLER